MLPEDRNVALVLDMLQFLGEVDDYTAGLSYDSYVNSKEKRRSVERVMELVGEAASQLSERFRADHPEVRWRDIVGLRHVLAHGYGRLDQARLWRVVANDVPELRQMLESILSRQ